MNSNAKFKFFKGIYLIFDYFLVHILTKISNFLKIKLLTTNRIKDIKVKLHHHVIKKKD